MLRASCRRLIPPLSHVNSTATARRGLAAPSTSRPVHVDHLPVQLRAFRHESRIVQEVEPGNGEDYSGPEGHGSEMEVEGGFLGKPAKSEARAVGSMDKHLLNPKATSTRKADGDSNAQMSDVTKQDRKWKSRKSARETASEPASQTRTNLQKPPSSSPKSAEDDRWKAQKEALEKKFPLGWAPRKRLSPDALDGIRALHASDASLFSTAVLADQFKVSPEAIRRILRSKWRPTSEQQEDRRLRWDRRGEKIWTRLAELGTRPPKKWRQMGVGRVDGSKGELPAWKKSQIRKRHAERQTRVDEGLYNNARTADSDRPTAGFASRVL